MVRLIGTPLRSAIIISSVFPFEEMSAIDTEGKVTKFGVRIAGYCGVQIGILA
jgi:hypothetical protein